MLIERQKKRVILLDYDGTLIPELSRDKKPSQEVLSILNGLCKEPENTIFIVSGRGRDSLSNWFAPCRKLGIAAEHGYLLRWPQNEEWGICGQRSEFKWKNIAEPVMKLYAEATDNSYIESKESALVWHYYDADPDFGSSQAKEMLGHLVKFLANEPVVVNKGKSIIEVKPHGVSKGLAAEQILRSMADNGKQADFVLCVGDDQSDEDMFEMIGSTMSRKYLSVNASVFACTVGYKPTKATSYLFNVDSVLRMLQYMYKAD